MGIFLALLRCFKVRISELLLITSGYFHHWHRLVKNIGWENQNIEGQKVVKSDKCMGVSQLLGGPDCPPKSMPMTNMYLMLRVSTNTANM